MSPTNSLEGLSKIRKEFLNPWDLTAPLQAVSKTSETWKACDCTWSIVVNTSTEDWRWRAMEVLSLLMNSL